MRANRPQIIPTTSSPVNCMVFIIPPHKLIRGTSLSRRNGRNLFSAIALILLAFPDQTGTATGVIGTIRFGCGAAAGPILAFFSSDSAMPFTYLIFISIVINGICFFWPNRINIQQSTKTTPSVAIELKLNPYLSAYFRAITD